MEQTDVYTLLEQYDSPPEELPHAAVTIVQDALRLSAPALEIDKTLLPGQLLGRLLYWNGEEWGDLPHQIQDWEWRLDSGEQVARFQLEQRPVSLLFSGQGNDIVISDAGGAVHFLCLHK